METFSEETRSHTLVAHRTDTFDLEVVDAIDADRLSKTIGAKFDTSATCP
jgi:hypothetical protein